MSRPDFLARLGAIPGPPPTAAPPAVPWQWQYAKPGPYITQLNPQEETQFQQWVRANKIPFDPSPTADYDMRGFWKAGGRGATAINPNDKRPHFTDKYKTPYHKSFSAESVYAAPGAPTWNPLDQLVDKNGRILFDERAVSRPPGPQSAIHPDAVQRVRTAADNVRQAGDRLRALTPQQAGPTIGPQSPLQRRLQAQGIEPVGAGAKP